MTLLYTKSTLPLLILTLLTAVCSLRAEEYLITVTSNNSPLATVNLKIEDGFATTEVAGIQEEYNLVGMKWKEDTSGRWISLEESEEWTEQFKQKTLESLNKSTPPKGLREFVEWSLSPSFERSQDGTKVSLVSGQVDYVIDGIAYEGDVNNYYKYAVLNSYKKAMTQKKLPPYSELKAIEAMKQLGYVPRSISVMFPGIPQAPSFKMEIEKI